jgi:hypothetical protein
LKDKKNRDYDDKMHILIHLKFKIPYFENFDRDILNMLIDRVVTMEFKEGHKVI